jgi:2-keto-3-deoxy-L-arabinonate dehydratase
MGKTSPKIEGVAPIIPTPFREDQSIDYDALAACVRFAGQAGVSAVCLPAYASEFYKLNEAERDKVIEAAVAAAKGRTLVSAQSNHPAVLHAADIARANEARGADLISFALPRMFAIPEADLLAYCRTICNAVKVPVLIQDFNPGGRTIGPDFCRRLADACPNFRYAKLEEPLMAPKLLAIREATGDRIGVLEGWGGMYMMELIEPGICGLMPGLAMADLLQEVWRLARGGCKPEAMDLFEKLLPQILFSLQNMELFLWMEKDLLARRGVIPQTSTHVRPVTYTPDDITWRHARELNERVVLVAKHRSKT